MKQKLIITISLILLAVVIFFMWKDFYKSKNKTQKNPYEYNIDNLRYIDQKQISYKEIAQINPDIEELKSITIDNDDQVYITGKGKVLIYKSESLINSFNIISTAYSIHVSVSGDIFIGALDHIEIYGKNGNLKSNWDAVNENSIITSIASDEKSVFIADAGNKVVYHYDFTGKLLNEIGRKDSLKGSPGFIIPSPFFDLLIGKNDELWVVNPGRHAFENYNSDGNLISSWNRTSFQLEGFSGCCNPSNIALLSDGSFVTSEKGLERVKIHSPSGDFKTVVAGPDSFEEGTKGIDLAVDSEDKIYVLDPEKKLVRIFEKKENE